jgi:hypothetical protein
LSTKGRKKTVVKSKKYCLDSDSDSDIPPTSNAAKRASPCLSDDDDDVFRETPKKPDKTASLPSAKNKPNPPKKQKQPPKKQPPKKKQYPLTNLPLRDNSPFVRRQTKPVAVSSRQTKGAENRPPSTQAKAVSAQKTPTPHLSPEKANRKRPHVVDVFDPKNEAFLAMPAAKKIKIIEEKIEIVKQEAASRQREVMADLDLFIKNEDRKAAMDRKRLHDEGAVNARKMESEKKKLDAALKQCEKYRADSEDIERQIRELIQRGKLMNGCLTGAEEARKKMEETVLQARHKVETIKADFENVSCFQYPFSLYQ